MGWKTRDGKEGIVIVKNYCVVDGKQKTKLNRGAEEEFITGDDETVIQTLKNQNALDTDNM